MAKEDVVEEAEEKDQKYITATLSKTDDADLIKRYNRLVKIGGFSPRDIFNEGVEAALKSKQYQEALRQVREELGE